MLRKWECLPERMKNDAVRPYYEILEQRQAAIAAKRAMDVVAALILTVFLSPLMLLIALMVKAEDGGPVFFRQERVTTYGKKFRIYKFRTMITGADKKGPLITGKSDGRITRTGKRLRGLRLDELPQLFNILSGDMSFVGTRPEVERYVDGYTDEMMATLLLPAGLTSRASIAFKGEDKIIAHYTAMGESVDEAYISRILPKKMRYNLAYLRRAGILEDLKIMAKTAWGVLR